jgi:hypothetical protein
MGDRVVPRCDPIGTAIFYFFVEMAGTQTNLSLRMPAISLRSERAQKQDQALLALL